MSALTKDFGFNLKGVFVIGYKRADIEMGQRLGATTSSLILDFVVYDLKAAIQAIEIVSAIDGRRIIHGIVR